MGNRWGRGNGNGEEGGGGSVYSQAGIRVDRNSRHDTEEGFQVSKRGVQGLRGGIPSKRGLSKDWGMHLRIYRANRVYRAN
jgi:hypothetical protein